MCDDFCSFLKAIGEKLKYLCCCHCCHESHIDYYVANNDNDDKKSDQFKPITFMTYNIELIFDKAYNKKDKASRIAQDILTKNVDLVCIQECFNEDMRKILVDELKQSYNYFVRRAGRNKMCGLLEDSGLFIASRYPLFDIDFIYFSANSQQGYDSLANKGVLNCRVQAPGHIVYVSTTHMQAYEELAHLRSKQLDQILESIPTDRWDALCFLGDLNIHHTFDAKEDNPETELKENEKTILVERLTEKLPTVRELTKDIPELRNIRKPDYIFLAVNPNSGNDLKNAYNGAKAVIDMKNDLSDHYPIYTTF